MFGHSLLGSTMVLGGSVANDTSHIVHNEAPGPG